MYTYCSVGCKMFVRFVVHLNSGIRSKTVPKVEAHNSPSDKDLRFDDVQLNEYME